MNKRQCKKNEKRGWERLADILEESHKHLVRFWCTHKPQNEREAHLIQYNLHALNYQNEQDRQGRREKERMRARGRAWKYRNIRARGGMKG